MPQENTQYREGVGVFIVKDNMLLLTHRSQGYQVGFWEVPAGGRKERETFEEAAIREVKEETSLEVRIIQHLGLHVNDEYHFRCHMMLAEIVTGVAQNMDAYNHEAVQWFPLAQLPGPLGSTTKAGVKVLS